MYFLQEKESLITELRKELRLSNEEHRELLGRVNADDMIQRIRSDKVMKQGFWCKKGNNIFLTCIASSDKRVTIVFLMSYHLSNLVQ